MIRTYCSTLDETKFKKAVKEVGGNIWASLPFLKDGCNDTVLKPSENGKQRKCITIPHKAISTDVIRKLVDRGKSASAAIHMLIRKYTYIHTYIYSYLHVRIHYFTFES